MMYEHRVGQELMHNDVVRINRISIVESISTQVESLFGWFSFYKAVPHYTYVYYLIN